MSVMDSFRGRFKSVTGNISSSITSITGSNKSKTKEDGLSSNLPWNADLDAGASLLNKYREDWEILSKNTKDNALMAQDIDQTISSLHMVCHDEYQAANSMMEIVSYLPDLIKSVKEAMLEIDNLEKGLLEVNSLLADMEVLTVEQEMTHNKHQHFYQLEAYKKRKEIELENIKVDYAKRHAKKAEGYELKIQQIIQEKQRAFQEEYNEEMENYRIYGQTLMKPVLVNKQTDISEVVVEEDSKAKADLDAFLDSDDDKPVEQGTSRDSNDCTVPEEEVTDESTISDNNNDVQNDSSADEFVEITANEDVVAENDKQNGDQNV